MCDTNSIDTAHTKNDLSHGDYIFSRSNQSTSFKNQLSLNK